MTGALSYDEAIAGTGPLPHPRLAIYRNNIAAALLGALKLRYPAFAALAGEEMFTALALGHGARHRPTSPVLIHYGADFADFVAARLPAEHTGLADVARLDSLWWRAYHAAEAPALAPQSFPTEPADLARACFRFHPSVGLLASPWPVADLWQSARSGASQPPLEERSQQVLVRRPEAEVIVSAIDAATFAFLQALMSGARLAEAVARAGAEPHFRLDAELQNLVTGGIVAGIDMEA